MKALVYNLDQKRLFMKEKDKPVCGDRDVLIAVKAVGICGGDLHYFKGDFDPPPGVQEEFTIGHEFAGVIEEVGKNADPRWKVGDRVVTDNTAGACGKCPACAKGHYVLCKYRKILGLGEDGGFTSYVVEPGKILELNPDSMFRIPENLSFAAATVLEPAANSYRAVIQEGKVKPGETVVIYGPGPIGLMCTQIAAIAGAAKIILVGRAHNKALRGQIGMKYGATHWVENDAGKNAKEQILEIAGDEGVDCIIDAAGDPSVLLEAIDIIRNEGTIVRAGFSDKPVGAGINAISLKSVRIFGHMGYDTECWKNCIRLAEAGKLDLDTIVTHQLPLDQWEEGFKKSIDGSAGKVVLIP